MPEKIRNEFRAVRFAVLSNVLEISSSSEKRVGGGVEVYISWIFSSLR